MSNFESSNKISDTNKRRISFQKRRLELLIYLKESIERRLSAVNAAIKTLEEQIKRTEEQTSN